MSWLTEEQQLTKLAKCSLHRCSLSTSLVRGVLSLERRGVVEALAAETPKSLSSLIREPPLPDLSAALAILSASAARELHHEFLALSAASFDNFRSLRYSTIRRSWSCGDCALRTLNQASLFLAAKFLSSSVTQSLLLLLPFGSTGRDSQAVCRAALYAAQVDSRLWHSESAPGRLPRDPDNEDIKADLTSLDKDWVFSSGVPDD